MNQNQYLVGSEELRNAFPFVEIIEKQGEGGQKFVYKANYGSVGKVAFKIIKVDQNIERTVREITAASGFKPPRFAEIYKFGQAKVNDEEVIYIVEEFIEGDTLRNRIINGRVSQDEATYIGVQLLYAVSEVSKQKLVHRDLKPENIMIDPNMRVVLLDFGIARHLELNSLTHDAAIFGPHTPGYAAPEQIKNEKRAISTRTDLFSWGVIMYEMINNTNPFTHGCTTSSEAILKTLKYQPPSLNNCNPELSKLIDWCLQKPVHRRPPNIEILIKKMEGVLK
ncbi:serine/threonine protein kinase [Peribacillus sp. Hz7]|uniref:serine/threonine protein kinase n=1 Tax=Peribacillus sp. Hz7 TaxID=3344873 RepID=UPI0035C96523